MILGDTSFIVLDSEIHHFYFGIAIVLISGFYNFFNNKEKYEEIDIAIFGFGSGLIIDELAYIMLTADTHSLYFSNTSIIGAFVFSTVFSIAFLTIFSLETENFEVNQIFREKFLSIREIWENFRN